MSLALSKTPKTGIVAMKPISVFCSVSEISDDPAFIVLLSLACLLTILVLIVFFDECLYLRRIHTNDSQRQKRVITLLGLYPVRIGINLTKPSLFWVFGFDSVLIYSSFCRF